MQGGASLSPVESGQPAHPYSLTRLYNVGRPSSSFHLDIPKNDNGQLKKMEDILFHLRNSSG